MIRILIADDEAIVRETIRSVIQMNFASLCELAVAGSGREVIDKCRSEEHTSELQSRE